MKILKYIAKQFNILKAVAFVTYKEWAAYRSHMLISLIVGPLNFFIQLFIWKAVFTGKTIVNGFTLEQMISYYGVVTLIHYLIMDFADWNLLMLIHTGRFITYAIKPMNHYFFAFSQKIGHRILGFIWEFIPVYLIFIFFLKIILIPASFLLFFISIILGFIMNFLINYSIGIIGFWIVKADGVRRMIQIFSMILKGAFIPLTFFPLILQNIMFYLPFQYSTYVPARVFLGSYELAGINYSLSQIVGVQFLSVLIMIIFTRILYNFGIKKFSGVGV